MRGTSYILAAATFAITPLSAQDNFFGDDTTTLNGFYGRDIESESYNDALQVRAAYDMLEDALHSYKIRRDLENEDLDALLLLRSLRIPMTDAERIKMANKQRQREEQLAKQKTEKMRAAVEPDLRDVSYNDRNKVQAKAKPATGDNKGVSTYGASKGRTVPKDEFM